MAADIMQSVGRRFFEGAWRKNAYVARAIVAGIILGATLVATRNLFLSSGLYEFGDATFPAGAFPASTMLPWDSGSNLGYDNVFISLPRLPLLVAEVLLLETFRNPHVAQAVLYFLGFVLGSTGAYALARSFGAGRLVATAAAMILAFNPWVAARVSQVPLFISFMATPWLFGAVIRGLRARRWKDAGIVAAVCPLVLGSLQIAYMSMLGIAIIVSAALTGNRREGLFRSLAWGAAALALGILSCSYFLFPGVFEAASGASGALLNVKGRFAYATFAALGREDTLQNALRLIGFLYSPFRGYNALWLAGLWLFPLAVGAALGEGLRRRNETSKALAVAAGLMIVLTLAIAVGSGHMQAAISVLWYHIPGMRGLIDPDYYEAAYIVGAVIAFGYARARAVRALVLLAAIVLFVPFVPRDAIFKKVVFPPEYASLPIPHDGQGRILWEPQHWANRYTWSPYIMSGWPILFSDRPAFGPYTSEITPPGSYRLSKSLDEAMTSGNAAAAAWMLAVTRTRYLLVSNDVATDLLAPVDPDALRRINSTTQRLVQDGVLRRILPVSTRHVSFARDTWSSGSCNGGKLRGGAPVQYLGTRVAMRTLPATVVCTTRRLLLQAGVNEITLSYRGSTSPPRGLLLVGDHGISFTNDTEAQRLFVYLQSSHPRMGEIFLYADPARARVVQYSDVKYVLEPSLEVFETTLGNRPELTASTNVVSSGTPSSNLYLLASEPGEPTILNVPTAYRGLFPTMELLDAERPTGSMVSRREMEVFLVPTPGAGPTPQARVGESRVSVNVKAEVRLPRGVDVSLLPVAERPVSLTRDTWSSGSCSGGKLQGGDVVQYLGTRVAIRALPSTVVCTTHEILLQTGVNEVEVSYRGSTSTPRGLLLVGARGVEFTNDSEAQRLVVYFKSSHPTTAEIFLYADPAPVGVALYSNVKYALWPSRALILKDRDAPPVGRPISTSERKIGPLSYEVHVGACDRPCALTGAWSYSPHWVAGVGRAVLPHVVANGYANAWLLPASEHGTTVRVYYATFAPFVAGCVVSILAYVFLAVRLARRQTQTEA